MPQKQKYITIVCGPTSTGKSDFVFNLAKNTAKALIISADSRQFYKDIPIVSGQDDTSNLPKYIKLVGQGFLESDQDFSISQFQKYFRDQLIKFPDKQVFVVGGSGLYLKSISQNLETASIPQNSPLREKLEKYSLLDLQQELKKLNIEKFNLLNNSDVNNPRRLVRAIEVASYYQDVPAIPASLSAGRALDPESSLRHSRAGGNPSNNTFVWLGLKKSKESLAEDIKKRVINRIDLGAIEEVKKLQSKYPNQKLPIYSTLGIKQILDFLSGKISEQELVDLWTQAELSYAKRQMVWFKKQPQIVWYDKDI